MKSSFFFYPIVPRGTEFAIDENKKKCSCSSTYSFSRFSHVNNLYDGCLMHIFSFLSPIPDSRLQRGLGS
ncbi:hypothetical protein L2E82_17474 [Cichorium intybus]|uniref:Uncharacterized protein n=1 Tax=Cichorium intybus TaxID=13427 RepID=A0ACB9F8D7_CICIN|nr:hypothetical protein L2E82_17474 [Cichorium intybus]